MKYYFASLLCFILYANCRKEKLLPNKTIQGVVIDAYTKQPKMDVNIDFFRWKSSGFWNTYYSKIELQKTKTDDEGCFRIDFRQDKDRVYTINFDKLEYYQGTYQFSETYSLEKKIELFSKGFVIINIVDDATTLQDDVILNIKNDLTNNNSLYLCSQYLPHTRTLDAIGNSFNIIKWTKCRNPECWSGEGDSCLSFTDSVWVNHNETIEFKVRI